MALNRQAGQRNAAPAPGGGGGGWLKRGTAGMAQSAQETQAQEQRDNLRAQGLTRISRYNLRVAEQGDIVILDMTLDGVPFLYEHRLQDPQTQRWNVFETCPKEFDSCPICDRDRSRPSQYMMMLSVMDLKGFTTRGGEFVPQSRRLMAVPHVLHDTFFNLCNAAMREHGTIRGMHLLMSRETQQEAAIGKPIMMEGGQMFEMMTEEEIFAEFQHPDIFNDQNQLIKAANVDLYPYDYDLAFPKPSGEDLRRRYGGNAPAGSRQQLRDEWNEGGHPHVNNTRTQVGATSRTPLPQPPAATRTPTPPVPQPPAKTEEPAPEATRTRTRAATTPAPAAPDPAPQRVRQRARQLDASEAEPIQERPPTPAQPPAPETNGGGRLRRRAAPDAAPRVADDLDDDPFAQ